MENLTGVKALAQEIAHAGSQGQGGTAIHLDSVDLQNISRAKHTPVVQTVVDKSATYGNNHTCIDACTICEMSSS